MQSTRAGGAAIGAQGNVVHHRVGRKAKRDGPRPYVAGCGDTVYRDLTKLVTGGYRRAGGPSHEGDVRNTGPKFPVCTQASTKATRASPATAEPGIATVADETPALVVKLPP